MTHKDFMRGMLLLTECYPLLSPTESQLTVWWELLKELNGDDYEAAVIAICSGRIEVNRAVSIPALIRNQVLENNPQTSGAEAWGEVMAKVRAVGRYGKPQFADHKTQVVVGQIGWDTICNSELVGVERAHFIRAYENYSEREKKEKLAHPALLETAKPLLKVLK